MVKQLILTLLIFSAIHLTQAQTCSGTDTLTATSQKINDGSGNNNYSNNLNCNWLIKPANNNQIVVFQMDSMDLHHTDRLMVYDRSDTTKRLLFTYSRDILGSTIYSHKGEMYFEFLTDSSKTKAGWSGSYYSLDKYCDSITILSGETDTISDGSLLVSNYLSNTNCSWLIKPLKGVNKRINFQFTRLFTQFDRDFVRFYDGESTNDSLLFETSATIAPGLPMPLVQSSGQNMLVTFNTNNNVNNRGWEGYYWTEFTQSCKQLTTLTASTGTFNDGSVDSIVYGRNNRCEWLIQPPLAKRIHLNFTRFETELHKDYISIYDGDSDTSRLIGKYSGSQLPPSILSSGKSLFLQFQSNNSINRKGWEAEYLSLSAQCLPNVKYTAIRDSISDGGDSSKYAHNLNCSWTIQPADADSIELDFVSFDLDSLGDSLYIYDGASSNSILIGAYTGTQLPPKIGTSGNSLHLVFKTDSIHSKKGWTAFFQSFNSKSCSGVELLTNVKDTILVGNTALNYENNLRCGWHIQPNDSNTRSIYFKMNNILLANGDIVSVYDYDVTPPQLIKSYQQSNDTGEFAILSSHIFVEFLTDSAATQSGWSASYEASNAFCVQGAFFKSDRGKITDGSPNGVDYANNSNCSWLIYPDSNVFINLRFNRFNTQRRDSVTVYDGATTSDSILGKYSFNRIPPSINSSGNKMLITFKSNGQGTRNGWEARFISLPLPYCNGTTSLVDTVGRFNDGSDNGIQYGPNSNCAWLIQPPKATNIELEFDYFDLESNDELRIYNGPNPTSSPIATYTGSTIPNKLKINNSSAFIEFTSNALIQQNGFEISYRAETKDSLNALADTLFISDTLGSKAILAVFSNIAWKVNHTINWLSHQPDSSIGIDTVLLTANQSNSTNNQRHGYLYITDQQSNFVDSVLIVQLEKQSRFFLNPDSLFYSARGTLQQNISVSSNVGWQLNNGQAWITLSNNNGTNNDTISVSVLNNTSVIRVGRIIGTDSAQSIKDTVWVIQDSSISVSLNDIKKSFMDEFEVYPNPAKKQLYVSIKNNNLNWDQLTVELRNSNGSLLDLPMAHSNKNTIELDLNGISSGIYILRLFNQEVQLERKIKVIE